MKLTDDERKILNSQAWLNDKLINAGHQMLKSQYGDLVSGLQDVTRSRTLTMDVETGEFVQILNKSDCHWFTISTFGCKHGEIKIYDSGVKYMPYWSKEEIAALVNAKCDVVTLRYMNVQHQDGTSDCGLFALAFATAIYIGTDPTSVTFNQRQMRTHYLNCIQKGHIEQFPLSRSRRPIYRPIKEDMFEVHCHCRMPHDNEERMIFCNGICKKWYHETCEDIEYHIWNSRMKWYCKNCKK